jgi:putative ABC transport system substrate-binding protein
MGTRERPRPRNPHEGADSRVFELIAEEDEPDRQIARMDRRRLLIGLTAGFGAIGVAALVGGSLLAPAQPARSYRIIFLFTRLTEPAVQSQIAMAKAGLADLGYVEGTSIGYEARDAKGEPLRFPELATEVVNLKPDLIVCQSVQAASALKSATRKIPVVFVGLSVDPVEAGIVASKARPGGNLTGFCAAPIEIWSKRLQLLKEAAPSVTRVAVLRAANEPGLFLAELERTALSLGIEILPISLRTPSDLEPALAAAVEGHANAIVHTQPANQLVGSSAGAPRIAQFALQSKWPSMVSPTLGGLMAYDGSTDDAWRRAATTIDRIFRGANPAEIPVEGPTSTQLRVNLCTAEKIGLTISPHLLAQATEVIRC